MTTQIDEWVFGWDPTPGIVSVWADRDGRALVWRRVAGQLLCEAARFRPWLFAATLDDIAPARPARLETGDLSGSGAPFSYRALDAQPDTYGYILTARDGRALERALLAGAARRLGRQLDSLYELDADYYRVGPVEQYLMLTGRVYFRDLTYAELHRLQFDLETTGLDPQQSRIFMVAVRDSRGLSTVLDAPTADDEPRLIADLCALIRERDPDVIENHNLLGFDLPFLETRAALLGVPLQLGRPEGPAGLERYTEPSYRGQRRVRYSIAGRELIDTLDAVRRHDFVTRDLPGHGLKEVARAFGIAVAERVYLPGAEIFSTYQRDPTRVRRYALDDVTEVDGLSQRLMGAAFALAGMAPRRYERVATAGSAMGILEPMLVRAYLRAGAALPRTSAARSAAQGAHTGGATLLFAAGVAEQVVKADIASMYPSLMRTYQIGPACDRLGVLLGVVGRLTDLRLGYKAAARSAAPGSLAANHANALQAAMKLIINSAYGYMGAGAMALFADGHAADEVTRRGREVLGQVVESLRARGMALIEADTDGVYFAVPLGWDAERERALVAEVGATLPDGIRLEYEGRYRAMLSHEVKNYALLTYDGELIMRGVALRSSRNEPFGERFLRRALCCVLLGDIAGVRDAYLETVSGLRDRTLAAADVAARLRLSKTPEEYAATRAGNREAPYEALLAAGRTHWSPGERVRCYRAVGGYVWLPDISEQPGGPANSQVHAEEQRRDYDVGHYLGVLLGSYAGRLKKAFAPDDFEQLFRTDAQLGLFDRPVEAIAPLRIAVSDP